VAQLDGIWPATVRARLLYRSISCRFAEDVLSDDTEIIAQFGDLYDAADKTPALVATAELVVP